MAVVDLPPGIGLLGTPLGTFHAPRRARRLALVSLVSVLAMAIITWWFVSRHWYRWHTSTQIVATFSLLCVCSLGLLVRSASLAVTRDGVRWGWTSLSFTQEAARIVTAHVYTDGVALEAKRGSQWFLAARDWDRFDGVVRQLRRAALPLQEHGTRAPFRMRRQSYGRVLDGLMILAMLAGFAVMLWAA